MITIYSRFQISGFEEWNLQIALFRLSNDMHRKHEDKLITYQDIKVTNNQKFWWCSTHFSFVTYSRVSRPCCSFKEISVRLAKYVCRKWRGSYFSYVWYLCLDSYFLLLWSWLKMSLLFLIVKKFMRRSFCWLF